MSADYPGLPFVEAAGFTSGRPDGPPLWLVKHTMQVSERSTSAEGTAAYFANPSDGRTVSAHTCVDNDSAVQCVRVQDSAWTVGNRPGNNRGINMELAGFAEQTAAQWQDDYSQAMLRRAAELDAVDVLRFGIPLRFLTVAQLQARDKGFTTHNDLRLAFGNTTHWDPGPNFPRAQYLDMVRAEVIALETGMTDINLDQVVFTNEGVDVKLREILAPLYLWRTLWTNGTDKRTLAKILVGLDITNLTTLTALPGKLSEILAAAVAADNSVTMDDADREALSAQLAATVGAELTAEIDAAASKAGAEARDAVGDLAEGGAAKVRADS